MAESDDIVRPSPSSRNSKILSGTLCSRNFQSFNAVLRRVSGADDMFKLEIFKYVNENRTNFGIILNGMDEIIWLRNYFRTNGDGSMSRVPLHE